MPKDRKRKKDEDPEIPDSMQEEVFIHQTLQKFGASEEEAIAFAKIYEKMIQALTDRLETKIDNGLELMRKGLDAIKESNKEGLDAIKDANEKAKEAMEESNKDAREAMEKRMATQNWVLVTMAALVAAILVEAIFR